MLRLINAELSLSPFRISQYLILSFLAIILSSSACQNILNLPMHLDVVGVPEVWNLDRDRSLNVSKIVRNTFRWR
jgi:hypothetical protein